MSKETGKKGKSRDGRVRFKANAPGWRLRLTFEVGGLRSGRTEEASYDCELRRLNRGERTKSVVGVVRLDLIVRVALIEWLVIRESHNSQKSIETDKNDILIIDNS